MAGNLSRSEDIQDYFRKKRGRQQENSHTPSSTSRTKSPRNKDIPSKCDSLGILIDKPKYKQYGTLQSRIASFENWPQDKTQEVRQLAEAGFAYTGVDDCVRCFYCSIGLKDWPEGACPWEQHVLASPDCGHVIQCKGKGYIRKIVGEKDEVVDTVQLAINRNEDAVIAAREYCPDEDIINSAIKILIKKDRQKIFSAVEIVKIVQKIEETNESISITAQSPEEDMEETNKKLKESITCKICFEGIACMIPLPCGHVFCCSQCILALTKCAVCRSEIKSTVRNNLK